MNRNDASAFERNKAGRDAGYAHSTSPRHHYRPGAKASQERSSDSLRPRTVLVLTGAAPAEHTGLACVSTLANAGHRVVAMLPEDSVPEEFTHGPVADRIACLDDTGTDAVLRNALRRLPARFQQIDTLVGMVCVPGSGAGLLDRNAGTLDAQLTGAIHNLACAMRAVLPGMAKSQRGHAVAVMLPEPGQRHHARAAPPVSLQYADLLIASLRDELARLGVRFTRIRSEPGMERESQLTSADVNRAVTWALGQPHHLAVCDIALQSAPLAQPALTRREREVLGWTACGKTSEEIARILNLSGSAVSFHITNLMSKLDSTNKTSAIARAAMLGLLP